MADSFKFGLLFFISLLKLVELEEMETKNLTGTSANNTVPLEENGLAYSVNSFGYNLLMDMMKDDKDKNIIISPTGIAGLLAMTLLGSVGRSYDELADTLGFSRDIRKNRNNHEQFGDLLNALNANTTSSKTLYADAVFVDINTQLRHAYSSYLARVYNGEAINVNFCEIMSAQTLLNDWVSNHTNNKIQNFIKDPLPAYTKTVLLSALYFNGQWKYPFTPNYTMQDTNIILGLIEDSTTVLQPNTFYLTMPFKRSDGEVMANLMLTFGDLNNIYSIEDDLQMIALPYNDSITTLYVLKPRRPETTTLAKLMQGLDYKKINKIIDQMRVSKVVVRFPKMDLHARSNLEDSIKSLGVRSIFSPKDANFALMINSTYANKTGEEVITRLNDGENFESKNFRDILDNLPNPGVYVDSIIHEVKLTMDEYGTEAVAVTSGVLARTAGLFYTDSPFYMFIRNEETKLVTFSAIINDPTT